MLRGNYLIVGDLKKKIGIWQFQLSFPSFNVLVVI